MKKPKSFLNVLQIITLIMMTSLFSFVVSCGEDEKLPEIPGTVSAEVPTFAVVNVPVTFIDKSLSVESRSWTITGGTPATSTATSVDVTFSMAGQQTVTLEVTFRNGTVVTETFNVTVAEELNGTIASTGGDYSFEFGDADIKYTFDLSIANEVGDADSYIWTFPAGSSPETSTEANPTVSFVGENPSVSVTLSRSTDGATLTISSLLETSGPNNLFTEDLWGFEADEVLSLLQTWDGDAGGPWADGAISVDDDSYDGKGIRINYPGDKGYYGVISRDFKEHNAQLVIGDIVLLSYYAKVVSGTPTGFSRIVNHVPSWSVTDPAESQNYQLYNDLGLESAGIGSQWTRVAVIDTLDNLEQNVASNVFPEIGFIGGGAAVVAFDKVELRLLGNIKD